jgi:hypothetical protein
MPAKKKRYFITDREDIAWRLRHNRRWSLKAIARHQGVTVSAISQRLYRLEKRFAGRLWTGRRRFPKISMAQVKVVRLPREYFER